MLVVAKAQNDYVTNLAKGSTITDQIETARYVGVIEGLSYLLNIEYEEASGEEAE